MEEEPVPPPLPPPARTPPLRAPSRPQLVRPPLAVPVPQSSSSSSTGRLISIRSRDFPLPTTIPPRPEFVPLIPSSKPRKPATGAEDAIDRRLPGPLSRLLTDKRRTDDGATPGARHGGIRRTATATTSAVTQLGAPQPLLVGGMMPAGAGAGSLLHGASHTSAIAKAQIEADLGAASAMAAASTATPSQQATAVPATPDFDPWDRDEPVQLPLRDPRESAADAMPQPFLDASGQLLYDDLFVLQLPSSLPLASRDQQPQQQQQTTAAAVVAGEKYEKQHEFETPPFQGNLAGLDGYMGRMMFHRSGRVTMRLTNGVEFELRSGSTPRFLEELFLVSVKSQTCYRLGPAARHITVLPNTVNIGLTSLAEAAGAAAADAALGPPPAAVPPIALSLAESQPPEAMQTTSAPEVTTTAAAAAAVPPPLPPHTVVEVPDDGNDDVVLMEVLPTR